MRHRHGSRSLEASIISLCVACLLFADASSTRWQSVGQPASAGSLPQRPNPAAVPSKRAIQIAQNVEQQRASTPDRGQTPAKPAISSSTANVTLTPTASPATAQPSVTVVNLTGSGFPSDTINANQVTVSLTPSTGGTPITAIASAITTIIGTTRRITFQIPKTVSVSTPTAFGASLSGVSVSGIPFQSAKPSALTILPAASISISPNSGAQGQSLTITITGQYTNFLQGSTVANFGPGVSVAGGPPGTNGLLTVSSPTSATAQLSISAGATVGPNNVVVATGLQQASMPFTISGASPPTITQLNPAAGQQGQTLPVTITGQFTHFQQGATTASFGPGISVSGAPAADYGLLTVNSATSATALLNIGGLPDWSQLNPTGPLPAPRLRHSSVYAADSNQLIIFGGTGAGGPLTPLGDVWRLSNANGNGQSTWTNVATQGLSVGTLWGHRAVYDSANDRMIVFGGITGAGYTPCVNTVLVLVNASGVNGVPTWTELNPQGAAPSGRRDPAVAYDPSTNRLMVFGGYSCTAGLLNDTWVLSNANGLGGPPSWTALAPSGSGPPTIEDAGAGYDPAHNSLTIVTESQSVAGPRSSGVWVLQNANGLGGPASWTQLVTPNSPTIPYTYLSVYDPNSNRFFFLNAQEFACAGPGTVAGEVRETWVLDHANGLGGSAAWSRLGPFTALPVTLDAPVYDSSSDRLIDFGGDTSASNSAAFSFLSNQVWTLNNAAKGSILGPRTVQINTDGEQVSLQQGFTVVPPVSAPPAVMASPSCSNDGATTDITLTGLNTSFTSGTTLANFGPGVATGGGNAGALGPVTVLSPTSAVAQITVAAAAPQNLVNIVMQMGSTQVTAPNAFYIAQSLSAPSLVTVAPSSGSLGQTLSVVVTGANTHFSQSGTEINFGSDITVNSVTVSSAISLTANITIPAIATLAGHTVTVQTGTEVASLSNSFTVFSGASIPAITISPNSGQQGQGGPVGIIGQNTHFVQGTTTVSVGAGITVSNVVVGCPTCLTATLSVSATAPAGPHDVTITTGSEVAVLTGGFTVTPGTPILTSLVPAAGQPGQTFSFTVTGNFTHFAQGTTQVSLGAGVTVSNISVTSLTALTAQAAVDPTATPGTRTLTVTTGNEVASAANVFTVQAASPILYTLNPGGGTQGQQNLSVVVTGLSTHFAQGTSVANFGPGVTVVSLTVASPTRATAVVNIAPTATAGNQTVTVTTGSEVASFVNGFTITVSPPIIYTLNPGGSSQGATNLPVTITGLNTHFAQGTSIASFGAGITVTALAVANATTATATINIDPAATIEPRTVTVTTGTEVASFINGFSVVAGVPGITEINPGGATQGAQNVSVAVTAQYTHFAQGITTATFGAGVTIASLTITSTTAATAVVNVDPAAAVGARNVTFTTGSEVVTAPGGFTISAGTPSLLSVNPNTGQQGQQNLPVTITGQLTHFVQGTTTASFGAGVTVTTLTVNSSTSATAVLNIAANATPGLQNVVVTTGSEAVTLTNGFGINAGAPSLTQISPNTGQQGQQNLLVTITGQNTHFNSSTSQVSFGAGITVSSVSVASATSLSASINIPVASPAGATSVTVTTGAEVATLAGGFTVQPVSSGPITANPASALQAQSISVTITGQGTHFAQGTTRARFGPGISVGSAIAGDFGPVTVTNPTSATAMISVVGNALPGSRTITVETGSETDIGTNAFTILGIPYISAVTPPGANQGASGTVTISGTYTHFAQGTSQVSFGAGVTVNSVTVTSDSSLTAAIAVDPAATPGPRPVSVVTGTENVSLANGFSVFGPITGPAPVPTISSPTEGAVVTAPTSVTGNVVSPNLAYWTLAYQAPGSTTFTQFATGSSAAVTGTLDPTLMLNGNAAIQLTGVDTSGQAATATTTVVIARNLKVGLFTLSFNDLSIPVAGLPIQVVRTYDSRRSGSSGDFGYGWTLDLNTVTVSTNIPLGQGWTMTQSGSFIINYCVQESTTHVITVTFADGTTYQFSPVLSGNCQQIVPPSQVNLSFAPNTTTGTTPPNAGLALGVSGPFEISGSTSGPVTLIDLDSLSTLDPDQFLSTLPDGRLFQISKQNGLQKETDLNGNTLTVTSAGITSSTGKSVIFTRDGQNRITQITDPSGNTLGYSYDAAGDLVSSTNQVNQASTYTYNLTHGLLTIVDPAGAQPIRNDYDASGRLVSHTDAYGNVINYDNDLADNQEIVTDRDGNITVNEYDSAGNIVQVTDALGGVTTRTYDANGNVRSETNALNETTTYTYDANNNKLTQTDPLGHTTTYTYNGHNQVLTVTDANNHTTTNTYDGNGNLLTTKDASGNVTTYTYNSAGLRTSMTDPLQFKTSYAYDAFGNLTQQTDALGHVTKYQYDGNGNKVSQTQTRTTSSGTVTMVTGYQYDGMNRVIKTTYPDNSTTQIQYNTIGKQGVTIDQLGRQTQYTYDLMGRLTQTTYPDTTSDSSTYDPNGNRISSTDRENRTTAYLYDTLNRLVMTTYPDTATSSTKYDAIGEVTLVTDALGNQTQYGYDQTGRRTQVTDALSELTTFQYDAVGNQTEMTDANINTTQYQYDPENRRTKAIYPDTTTDQTAYDALSRTTSKTDQAGLVTQYFYDGLGRLVQVTDALTHNTTYAYDEVGNRISQTDANTHTTTFAYDNLGRPTGRTLPFGMSEAMTYDLAGNEITHTDFDNKTTTFAYDPNNNWLTSKTPDASFQASAVTFTYTATGQRQSMTDPSGTTNYAYDLRDRLTQKTTPEGTLTYTYDRQGNLKSMTSSNSGGTSVAYSYDALNRLSSVKDNRLASGMTTYTYDKVGNLQGYVYPNAVQTAYQYDTLNRLKNITVSNGAPIASYAYTLGPAGNRTQVVELGGRTVAYGYDNLYRLTNETISGAPSNNGAIGYMYDPVGNRQSRASTVAPVPAASYTYDANDRLTTDTYDADGKTTASGGNTYTYDYENHLTGSSANGFSAVYDGDGNRVARTASGTTTAYLVDDRNLTGYAQVVEELTAGAVQRVYTYGLNRISQSQASGTSFYGYDGHGNVRLLTDTTRAVTDRYDYDAFGNILGQTGTTPNVYLYSGEQNDPNLTLYYLRARYSSVGTGRFFSFDSNTGNPFDPSSLHKYVYSVNDPADRTDPSGNQSLTLTEVNLTFAIAAAVVLQPTIARAFTALDTALVTLWSAGQISTITDPGLATALSTSAPQVLAQRRADAEAQVDTAENQCNCRGEVLFHYTSKYRALAIVGTQTMFLSKQYTNPGTGQVFLQGAYATDIAPWEPGMTQSQLATIFYFNPFKQLKADLSWFVALCNDTVPFFQSIGGQQWYKPDGNVHAILAFQNPMP